MLSDQQAHAVFGHLDPANLMTDSIHSKSFPIYFNHHFSVREDV